MTDHDVLERFDEKFPPRRDKWDGVWLIAQKNSEVKQFLLTELHAARLDERRRVREIIEKKGDATLTVDGRTGESEQTITVSRKVLEEVLGEGNANKP